MTKQTIDPINEPTQIEDDRSAFRKTCDNLEARDDVLGQSYRTIRDNPKTSAGIAAGVAAAAAGGAFLLNRKNRIGTATDTTRTGVDGDIVNEVQENNAEELSRVETTTANSLDRESKSEIKSGAVAY